MTTALAAVLGPLVGATSSKSSSGGISFIFILVLIAVAGYFLLLRPKRQQQQKQRAAQSDIKVGDEVLTVGGIVGRVLEMKDDRVTLLTGHLPDGTGHPDEPPHRIHMLRKAISGKVEPMAPSSPEQNGAGHLDLPDEADLSDDEAEAIEPDDIAADGGASGVDPARRKGRGFDGGAKGGTGP